MKRLLPALIALLITTLTPAQLVLGDIGVTGFLTNQFTVLHADGTSTLYPTNTWVGISHAFLYDPFQPNSFLIGGTGFFGRVTVTGPGLATYIPITTAVGTVTQLAFKGSVVLVCDSGLDQVYLIDPATGLTAPITTGPQPWGADLSSACIEPGTGDIYAGGNNGIWVIPSGTTTPLPLASGWAMGSSFVSGLAIDPFTLQPVATLLTVNRFVSIAPSGTLTDISPPFALPGPNYVEVDASGDYVIGASLGQIYRVANSGGTPVLIGTATGIQGAATCVSVVRDPFALTATPVGVGGVLIGIGGIPPGIVEGFTVPSFDISLPVGMGPIFGLSPDALSFTLVSAFLTAAPGNPIHWTWPVPLPFYPAAPVLAPPGTLASGVTLDLLAVGLNPVGVFRPAPVVRVTLN